MATQLFLLTAAPDTHRGTNTAKRNGVASGWYPGALGTSRGASVSGTTGLPVAGPTNGVEVTVDGSIPFEWISPPVSADVTISGTITANIWGRETDMSGNVAINVIIDIIRSATSGADASNTIVNIVQSTRVTELAVSASVEGVNNFTTGMTSGAYTGQTLNRGDRLRIRVVGDDVGTMAAAGSFTTTFNGATPGATGDTYVTFTENFSFESAPGVYGNTNFTSGYSFGNSTTEQVAQAFVPDGTLITEVKAGLSKFGSPTDNTVVEIQTDSAGSPSGSVVGTVATVGNASLTTTVTLQTWSSLSISVTAAQTYWLVFRRSGALDGANYMTAGRVIGGTLEGLTAQRFNAGAWVTPGDCINASLLIADSVSVLYLTDTASAVSTASVDKEAWTSRGSGVTSNDTSLAAGWVAPIHLTDTGGGTVIDWFTKQLAAFTLTGMAVANIRAYENNALANASLRCEIARVNSDGTSPTVWASWCIAPTSTDNGELTTSEVARTAYVSGDDLAFTDGQRIRIRLYADNISSAAMAAYNVFVYYAGTSGGASGDTYITLPQTVTEYSAPAAGGLLPRRQKRASRYLTFR